MWKFWSKRCNFCVVDCCKLSHLHTSRNEAETFFPCENSSISSQLESRILPALTIVSGSVWYLATSSFRAGCMSSTCHCLYTGCRDTWCRKGSAFSKWLRSVFMLTMKCSRVVIPLNSAPICCTFFVIPKAERRCKRTSESPSRECCFQHQISKLSWTPAIAPEQVRFDVVHSFIPPQRIGNTKQFSTEWSHNSSGVSHIMVKDKENAYWWRVCIPGWLRCGWRDWFRPGLGVRSGTPRCTWRPASWQGSTSPPQQQSLHWASESPSAQSWREQPEMRFQWEIFFVILGAELAIIRKKRTHKGTRSKKPARKMQEAIWTENCPLQTAQQWKSFHIRPRALGVITSKSNAVKTSAPDAV